MIAYTRLNIFIYDGVRKLLFEREKETFSLALSSLQLVQIIIYFCPKAFSKFIHDRWNLIRKYPNSIQCLFFLFFIAFFCYPTYLFLFLSSSISVHIFLPSFLLYLTMLFFQTFLEKKTSHITLGYVYSYIPASFSSCLSPPTFFILTLKLYTPSTFRL